MKQTIWVKDAGVLFYTLVAIGVFILAYESILPIFMRITLGAGFILIAFIALYDMWVTYRELAEVRAKYEYR